MDVLALIIVVVLIMYLMQVGFPRSARQLSVSRTFLRFYFRRIFSSWVLLGITGIILLHDGIPLSSIGLLLPNPWWPTLLAFIGVGILFFLLLVMHLRTRNDEQLVAKLAREKRRLALPRTSSERLGGSQHQCGHLGRDRVSWFSPLVCGTPFDLFRFLSPFRLGSHLLPHPF